MYKKDFRPITGDEIRDAVNDLWGRRDSGGCYRYVGYRERGTGRIWCFAIGWTSYDEESPDIYYDSGSCLAIRCVYQNRNAGMSTDLDWDFSMPVYAYGGAADTTVVISREENYTELAEEMNREMADMLDVFADVEEDPSAKNVYEPLAKLYVNGEATGYKTEAEALKMVDDLTYDELYYEMAAGIDDATLDKYEVERKSAIEQLRGGGRSEFGPYKFQLVLKSGVSESRRVRSVRESGLDKDLNADIFDYWSGIREYLDDNLRTEDGRIRSVSFDEDPSSSAFYIDVDMGKGLGCVFEVVWVPVDRNFELRLDGKLLYRWEAYVFYNSIFRKPGAAQYDEVSLLEDGEAVMSMILDTLEYLYGPSYGHAYVRHDSSSPDFVSSLYRDQKDYSFEPSEESRGGRRGSRRRVREGSMDTVVSLNGKDVAVFGGRDAALDYVSDVFEYFTRDVLRGRVPDAWTRRRERDAVKALKELDSTGGCELSGYRFELREVPSGSVRLLNVKPSDAWSVGVNGRR